MKELAKTSFLPVDILSVIQVFSQIYTHSIIRHLNC